MTAPTPGEVFGTVPVLLPERAPRATPASPPRASARFFDYTGSPVARRRARALTQVIKSLEDTLAAARALHRGPHLDLDVERYRRETDRLDDALQELDDALADPAGPPPPRPAARP